MPDEPLILETAHVEATVALGRRLGEALGTGDVIGLIGPLGAGKTVFVKGVAAGAGVADQRQVNSPTFVIVNEYDADGSSGALRIHHVDAYRLHGPGDLDALGFDEMCQGGAVVIEWADRVIDLLPPDRLTLELEPVDDHRRRVRCLATGPNGRRLLGALLGETGPTS